MDCRMPPRIAYWTSAFQADMEAIASEVALLRMHYPYSVTWGMHSHSWLHLSLRQRLFCLHPTGHLIFRFFTRCFEPLFDLNHIFGSPGDWFYLEGRRTRPMILTVATLSAQVNQNLLARIDRFVVEYSGGKQLLANLGIAPNRIQLIYPPVDLQRFAPSPPPEGPFTVLFASSPDQAQWLEARGVPLILQVAQRCPHIRFRLLWRPWGNSHSQVKQWIQDLGLRNVEFIIGRATHIANEYKKCHITIIPFTSTIHVKPAPNSLLESLACGRPVLVTEQVGLADLVAESGSGVVTAAVEEKLVEGLEQLHMHWTSYAQIARFTAERFFGKDVYLKAYADLYASLLK